MGTCHRLGLGWGRAIGAARSFFAVVWDNGVVPLRDHVSASSTTLLGWRGEHPDVVGGRSCGRYWVIWEVDGVEASGINQL